MFLISLFDFIAKISTVIYYLIKQKQNREIKEANYNSLLIFFVIFLFLFSRLILLSTSHFFFYCFHCLFNICSSFGFY